MTPEALGLPFGAVLRPAFLSALLVLGCSSGDKPVPFDDGKGTPPTATAGARLDYPAPPFGATQGATIANFEFLGWSNPKTAAFDTTHLETHSLAEFYDPTGEKGVQYLMITSTAVWCSACKSEYQEMAPKVATYEARGARFMGALFEDNDSNPARPSDLATWAKTYAVTFPFMLDPGFSMGAFFAEQATPMVMIVDTHDMSILTLEENGNLASVWAFLDQNLKP